MGLARMMDGVIPRLAADLKNELPEQKGFSERNIKRMLRFYQEYSDVSEKVPQPVALLQSSASQGRWGSQHSTSVINRNFRNANIRPKNA